MTPIWRLGGSLMARTDHRQAGHLGGTWITRLEGAVCIKGGMLFQHLDPATEKAWTPKPILLIFATYRLPFASDRKGNNLQDTPAQHTKGTCTPIGQVCVLPYTTLTFLVYGRFHALVKPSTFVSKVVWINEDSFDWLTPEINATHHRAMVLLVQHKSWIALFCPRTDWPNALLTFVYNTFVF